MDCPAKRDAYQRFGGFWQATVTSFEPIGVSPTFASSVGGLDRADGSGEEEVSDEEVTVDADMYGNGDDGNSEVEDLFEALAGRAADGERH